MMHEGNNRSSAHLNRGRFHVVVSGNKGLALILGGHAHIYLHNTVFSPGHMHPAHAAAALGDLNAGN